MQSTCNRLAIVGVIRKSPVVTTAKSVCAVVRICTPDRADRIQVAGLALHVVSIKSALTARMRQRHQRRRCRCRRRRSVCCGPDFCRRMRFARTPNAFALGNLLLVSAMCAKRRHNGGELDANASLLEEWWWFIGSARN